MEDLVTSEIANPESETEPQCEMEEDPGNEADSSEGGSSSSEEQKVPEAGQLSPQLCVPIPGHPMLPGPVSFP